MLGKLVGGKIVEPKIKENLSKTSSVEISYGLPKKRGNRGRSSNNRLRTGGRGDSSEG